jgi:hypothetical protein
MDFGEETGKPYNTAALVASLQEGAEIPFDNRPRSRPSSS